MTLLEGVHLSAEAQAAVLKKLCGELGATELGDLEDLDPEDTEALVALTPRLKQKVLVIGLGRGCIFFIIAATNAHYLDVAE